MKALKGKSFLKIVIITDFHREKFGYIFAINNVTVHSHFQNAVFAFIALDCSKQINIYCIEPTGHSKFS